MHSADTVARARELFSALPRPLGFVPTMGALHDGHLALVRSARAQCAAVAASVFVNPLQFGPSEDLARYPRELEADRAKLAGGGVDVLFAPEPAAMYPPGFATAVEVEPLGALFEGAQRPGHFRGVTTVIAKLLNVVCPDVLFLGQKDAQQAAVLAKMIADLNVPVRLAIVPTMREPDGLAMSSRNHYLDERSRAQAPSLYRTLLGVRAALARGESKTAALATGRAALSDAATLEYLDVVDAGTFAPLDAAAPHAIVIGAARFGTTRLIDNVRFE